ncbi:citrate/2-methylcitrate synthase [Sphingomonas sp. MMS24-JH45]
MAIGLDDVVAAETMLSDVDGANGRLSIRGRTLDKLVGRVGFERVVHLLLDGAGGRPVVDRDATGAARRGAGRGLCRVRAAAAVAGGAAGL